MSCSFPKGDVHWTSHGLQHLIDGMHQFCLSMGLTISPTKTKVAVFSVMSRAHHEQVTLSLEIDIDPCHDDGSVTAITSVTCQLLDCYYYCHCVNLMKGVSVIRTPVHDLGLHALLVSALPSALPLPCFSAHKVETLIQQVGWRPGPGPSDLNKATLNGNLLYYCCLYCAHSYI